MVLKLAWNSSVLAEQRAVHQPSTQFRVLLLFNHVPANFKVLLVKLHPICRAGCGGGRGAGAGRLGNERLCSGGGYLQQVNYNGGQIYVLSLTVGGITGLTQPSSASIQHSSSNKKQLLTTLAPLLHSHSVKLATPCVLNYMFTSKRMSCDMRAGLIFSLIILLKNALCWKNVTLVKIHILKVQQSDPHTPTCNTRPGICRDVNLRSQGEVSAAAPVGVQGAVCQPSDYHLTHTDTSQWRWQRNFTVNNEHNIWIRCL